MVLEGVYLDLLKAFLPDGVLDYFEVKGIDKKGEQLTLQLEEKNLLPDQFKGQPFHSKGFLPPVLIEDFPIRGQRFYFVSSVGDGSTSRVEQSSQGIGL